MVDLIDELRQAVKDRPHWTFDAGVATYARPGARWVVRARPSARPSSQRDVFAATLYDADLPTRSTTCRFADELVLWAERGGALRPPV